MDSIVYGTERFRNMSENNGKPAIKRSDSNPRSNTSIEIQEESVLLTYCKPNSPSSPPVQPQNDPFELMGLPKLKTDDYGKVIFPDNRMASVSSFINNCYL